jgi:hypothetical protein
MRAACRPFSSLAGSEAPGFVTTTQPRRKPARSCAPTCPLHAVRCYQPDRALRFRLVNTARAALARIVGQRPNLLQPGVERSAAPGPMTAQKHFQKPQRGRPACELTHQIKNFLAKWLTNSLDLLHLLWHTRPQPTRPEDLQGFNGRVVTCHGHGSSAPVRPKRRWLYVAFARTRSRIYFSAEIVWASAAWTTRRGVLSVGGVG